MNWKNREASFRVDLQDISRHATIEIRFFIEGERNGNRKRTCALLYTGEIRRGSALKGRTGAHGHPDSQHHAGTDSRKGGGAGRAARI